MKLPSGRGHTYRSLCPVYLGLNDKKVHYLNKDLLGDKRYEYGVEWGLAHPSYIFARVRELKLIFHLTFSTSKEKAYDIGVWRLDKDVRFRQLSTQPICLPSSFDRSDVVKDSPHTKDFPVYTSGWGRVFSACVTNELGPVKAIKCQFPFNSNYFNKRKRSQMEYSCSRKLTPDAKVPLARPLFTQL